MHAIIEKTMERRNAEDAKYMRMRPIGQMKTRDDDNNPIIEGYFAVFNSTYELWEGATESIAPGAFDNTISGDIRALTNHDTTLVLGRTTNNTLELRADTHGLWGRIKINPKDLDAMNLHARVERGDVSQCSFGFFIVSEETEYRDDGSIHWTITEVDLFEVSCCTFPAYEATSITARANEYAAIQARKRDAWREMMRKKIHKNGGPNDGN